MALLVVYIDTTNTMRVTTIIVVVYSGVSLLFIFIVTRSFINDFIPIFLDDYQVVQYEDNSALYY
jgi:hypothetical protein